MMEWRPKGYLFDTKNLVRALFDEQTDEGKLLVSAAAGNIEIFSYSLQYWRCTRSRQRKRCGRDGRRRASSGRIDLRISR